MQSAHYKPLYQQINGIRFPCIFSPKCIKEALTYKPTLGELFVVTYPKCGTTWTQCLVLHILRKGVTLEDPGQFFLASPFIDMLGNDGIEKRIHPGPLKTHLPFTHMPYSTEAKYIFVVRNPFDTCVSLYHHTRMLEGFGFSDGKFDDFFELFLNGEVEYNDYFDHLLSWYPHKDDKNIFYITYEDMKKDTKSAVLRMADFIGKEHSSLLQKDNGVLNNVLHYGSFAYMKKNFEDLYDPQLLAKRLMNNPNAPEGLKYLLAQGSSLNLPKDRPKVEFVRKGIVGDWKNHFSPEQVDRLNKRFDEKAKGTDLRNLWPA